MYVSLRAHIFFFFNDTATTEIYTLSLHDALPICLGGDLVLSDGHPGTADARVLQAPADHDADEHQEEEQVVVQRDRADVVAEDLLALGQVQAQNLHRVDLAYALGAVGDVDRLVQVVHEDADDFADRKSVV